MLKFVRRRLLPLSFTFSSPRRRCLNIYTVRLVAHLISWRNWNPSTYRRKQPLSKYNHSGEVYIIETQLPVRCEREFSSEAFDMSIKIKGHFRRNKTDDNIIGFVMRYVCAIKPSKLMLTDKINVFQQIHEFISQLHECQIIRSDIKFSEYAIRQECNQALRFGKLGMDVRSHLS